jgi:hypothetical protein
MTRERDSARPAAIRKEAEKGSMKSNKINPYTRLAALMVIAIACGALVAWCITRVGDVNGQAAVLQACMSSAAHHYASCPGIPVTAAQVANLYSESQTIGTLGWAVTVFIGIDVAGGLLSLLKVATW